MALKTEPRPSFAPLDWAIIALLQSVATRITLPVLARWQHGLQDDARRLKNLAAGLLFTFDPLPSQPDASERDYLFRISTGQAADLAARGFVATLLDAFGPRLFNSYYYSTVEAFGELNLVPVVPGMAGTPREPQRCDLQTFVRACRLPFHLNEAYAHTYSAIVLPFRAGLTPQICRLHACGLGERVVIVPAFLGDLSLLLKREDFVHRHCSAMVGVLSSQGRREDVLGAFLLTSAVLDAFGPEESQAMASLLQNEWDAAPLAQLHADVQRTSRGVRAYAEWPQIGTEPADIFTVDALEPLKRAMAFQAAGPGLGLTAIFRDSSGVVCRATCINFEAVERVIRGTFPVGPWLDPSLVTASTEVSSRVDILGDAPIALPDIRRLSSALNVLTSPKSNVDERTQTATDLVSAGSLDRGLLDILIPAKRGRAPATLADDLLTRSKVYSPPDRPELRLIVTWSGRSRSALTLRTRALIRAVLRLCALGAVELPLPGALNRVFASVQDRWTHAHVLNEGIAPAVTPGNRRSGMRDIVTALRTQDKLDSETLGTLLYSGVSLLCEEDADIRAILLLREETLFIPDNVEVSSEVVIRQFWNDYLCYPSFWMFESLNHFWSESTISLGEFTDPAMPSPGAFWSRDTNGDSVTMRLSGTLSQDLTAAAAAAYLGLPVSCWTDKPANMVPDAIPTSERGLLEAYRQWLSASLQDAWELAAVRRAFAHAAGNYRVSKVRILNDDASHGIRQELTVTEKGGQAHIACVVWQPMTTVGLQFCALNTTGIINDYRIENSYPQGDSFLADGDSGRSLRLYSIQRRAGLVPITTSEGVPGGSELRKFQESLVAIHNNQRTVEAEAWKTVIGVLSHEVGNALPAVEDLVAVSRSPSALSIPDAADRCFRSLAVLKLHVAAYSSKKSEPADLFCGREVSGEAGVREIAQIASDLGVALARRRNAAVSLPWYSYMRKLVQGSMECTLNGKMFWKCYRGEALDRRLGSEVILASAIANAIQHLTLYLANHTAENGQTDIDVLPPAAVPEDALVISISDRNLVITNRSQPPINGNGATDSALRIGSIEVLRYCCQSSLFGWSHPGAVAAAHGERYFALDIRLPQPFWSEDTCE